MKKTQLPVYFRPFIGAAIHPICNDQLGAQLVRSKEGRSSKFQVWTGLKCWFCRSIWWLLDSFFCQDVFRKWNVWGVETVPGWWFQIFVHPYLGKISNLTNIFQMGWNHQLGSFFIRMLQIFPHPICSINLEFCEQKNTVSPSMSLSSWICLRWCVMNCMMVKITIFPPQILG